MLYLVVVTYDKRPDLANIEIGAMVNEAQMFYPPTKEHHTGLLVVNATSRKDAIQQVHDSLWAVGPFTDCQQIANYLKIL